ncbi:MAG: aminopeptidase [Termitinemataceae bacterium]|nr:MAG: aminopeptidase [Termitinemataceae bacterium]
MLLFYEQSLLLPKQEQRELLCTAARVAVKKVLKLRSGEQVLIITNPSFDVATISAALYDAASTEGANVTVIFQPEKTQIDFAEKTVIAAFNARPDVVISISSGKLGKDEAAIAKPLMHNGAGYDHIFHLLQYGEKSCRGFWSPSVTIESFIRTVPIDYVILQKRCEAINEVLDAANSVRVTALAGTNITLGLRGRIAKADNGDFSEGGSGGNMPAGESFISPENNTAEGTIVFDGSISLHEHEVLVKTPITCSVRGGFVDKISGGEEADELRKTITLAEIRAREFALSGKLPEDKGEVYAKNARNIGELGIGLNPAAKITGNMLEDEKAFKTCHFAIGQNYDEDAPALIHLDGLVREPTIVAQMPDGKEITIMKDGVLTLAY